MKTSAKKLFMSSLVLVTLFILTFPGQAAAIGLSTVSYNYVYYHDQWEPNEYPMESHADAGGVWHVSDVTKIANSFSYDAYAYAQGRIYFPNGMWMLYGGNKGSGAYRKWFWDSAFKVTGDPGEKTNIFIDLMWYGSAWVELSESTDEAGSYAKAYSNYSLIVSDQTQTLLDLDNHWELFDSKDWGHYGNTFGSYPEPFYLGQMTVGDTFSLSSYLEANANAYVTNQGTLQARMDAHLNYVVTAEEIPAASVPEPYSILLLGFGLLSLAGYGRRNL